MESSEQAILVLGYGNPGRLDDGLGPLLIEQLEQEGVASDVTLDSNYQLCVEDSAAIAHHEAVVFVDADVAGPEPFWFGEVIPEEDNSFSTHTISPKAVLNMAMRVMGGEGVKGYVLGIRGYEFNEFDERLSEKAMENLCQAKAFMKKALLERDFNKYILEYGKDQ